VPEPEKWLCGIVVNDKTPSLLRKANLITEDWLIKNK
jgi:hypothetical protein